MVKFTLTRMFYNDKGVFGELSCRNTGFHCATVERLQVPENWQKMTPTQKVKHCIPKGEYPMKYKFDENINLVFVIKGINSWRNSHFVPDRIRGINEIAVGKEWVPDGKVTEGEKAMELISKYLQTLYEDGLIPSAPKYGHFTLEIVEAPDYHEENGVSEEENFEKMVDEDDDFFD